MTRLALVDRARAVVDRERRLPGRGAYVCDDACLREAARRGGLSRAFRARVASAPEALDPPATAAHRDHLDSLR